MYTWGYVKDAILAKLYMSEEEAKRANFLGSFGLYANECLTQIASTIRPKQASYKFVTLNEMDWLKIYKKHFDTIVEGWQDNNLFNQDEDEVETLQDWINIHKDELEDYIKNTLMKNQFVVGKPVSMPEDFINYNGQSLVFQKTICGKPTKIETNPENIRYIGEREFIPLVEGEYIIEYDAWWHQIPESVTDSTELETPRDVTECISPYVASKLWLTDDVQRSAIFKNEFELAFSRINNADYRNNTHFVSEGGW